MSEAVERKKSSKRKRSSDGEEATKKRKEAKLAKKARKEKLMQQLPKVDENGISYTKLQLRRMRKRVEKGLPPIPTREEELEKQKQEAALRKEEQDELAGYVYNKESTKAKIVENDPDESFHSQGESEDGDKVPTDDDEEEEKHEIDTAVKEQGDRKISDPQKPKKKRSKAVPSDYVCSACNNSHVPAHWIYDCPDKVTMKGSNQKKKKLRGLHAPDSRKVFVSGLPFDVKSKEVQNMFKECGKVASCRLVTFEDTSRCKGLAYVTFATEEAAEKALKMSGTLIENAPEDNAKARKTKKEKERRDLKLKVSRVVNRSASKPSKQVGMDKKQQ